jgi:hypothetical protein
LMSMIELPPNMRIGCKMSRPLNVR